MKLAKGKSVQLAATAFYSDNTSHPVTDMVSYHVEDDSVITVSSSGLLFGESEGVTRLTVSKSGIVSNVASVNVTSAVITAIKVMPASVSVPKGTGLQLVAPAQYSDGSSSDSPGQFLWASANPMIAEVNELGMVTGKALGTTTITASSSEISSGQVDTKVTDAVLTKITTSDNTITLAKGQTKQLSATAWYSDGTSSDQAAVVWLSSDPNIATITADSGVLRAEAIGDAVITAVLDNIVSPDIEVNATAAVITDIAVTPSKFIVKQTANMQLSATATFSDSTSSNITDSVTWEANDPNAATITPNGLLTGVNPGNAFLTAKKDGGISNIVNFEILCDTRNDCIDVVDLGDGTLFTNNPSTTSADKYNIIYSESFDDVDGLYALFDISEGEAACLKFKNDGFSGRSNWRVPTIDEMLALYQEYGSMHNARGWPYIAYYQSTSQKKAFNMMYGNTHTIPGDYISCVSEP